MASSLRRKSGWVITSSRSTSETIAPAMNAPRMTSRPSVSATAAKPTSRRSAPRTRIWAVVSCSRTRSARRRRERSAPRSTTKTAIDRVPSAPSRSSVEPVPPSPEKNTESRMIAPKSAIVAAATTSCPNGEAISPASLSTGMSTPSEVAQRMIATSSGVSTSPAAPRPSATARAIANESAKPSPVRRSTSPRSRAKSISRPARKSTKASPISAITAIESSTTTRPRTDGPTTIPAMISSTTDGSRAAGSSPSARGTTNATATTISRSVNEGATRCIRGRTRFVTPSRAAASLKEQRPGIRSV